MGRRLSDLWMVIPPIPSDEEFDWARDSTPELRGKHQILSKDCDEIEE
jgi:hypothetical protein